MKDEASWNLHVGGCERKVAVVALTDVGFANQQGVKVC